MKLIRLAPFLETALAGRVDEARDLLGNEFDLPRFGRPVLGDGRVSVAGAARPALTVCFAFHR